MKCRSGFVSNSSSSSFLLAGVQMDRLIAERLLALAGIEVPWGPEEDDDSAPWDEFDEPARAAERLDLRFRDGFIGKQMLYVSDEGYGSGAVSIGEINSNVKELADKLGVAPETIEVRLVFSGMTGVEVW